LVVWFFVRGGGVVVLGGVGSTLRALRPGIRLFAVEPAGCPSLERALAAGAPVEVQAKTICDGVAVPYITHEMFPLLRGLTSEIVLVPEENVRRTIRLLALEHKIIVEGAGALALAAALEVPLERRGKSVCLVTGGSIDVDLLIDILGTIV
jgi:threonine dehydratase